MSAKRNNLLRELKALVFQITDEELESKVPDSNNPSPNDDSGDFTRGGGDDEEEDPMTGDRSEYWFSHIENTTDENAKRSRENKLILSRLDLRTTWIMRILLAIVGAVAVSYLTTIVPL